MNDATYYCDISRRDFEILSFIVRSGRIYRKDRQSLVLSTVDDVPGEITRRVRSQRAQGRSVIVLEHGAIKADYCYLHDSARPVLRRLTQDDYRTLLRNVEVMHGVSWADFQSHLLRSFP